MKLIFAQGNPGLNYTSTRHNIGYTALDSFAAKLDWSFVEKPKFYAYVAEGQVDGQKILLAKPTTFYNETGRSARAIAEFYKLNPASDILVVHDDIALPLGTVRVRQKGSGAGNNGIKSLNNHLGPDYWRLRVGIYNDMRDKMHDADFVLSRFSKDEVELLTENILPDLVDVMSDFARDTIESHSFKQT